MWWLATARANMALAHMFLAIFTYSATCALHPAEHVYQQLAATQVCVCFMDCHSHIDIGINNTCVSTLYVRFLLPKGFPTIHSFTNGIFGSCPRVVGTSHCGVFPSTSNRISINLFVDRMCSRVLVILPEP